ncbi:Cob(I)yrinic acid a,c-diamide adenosyltransferase [archaeon HR01]|nr:Cob(I)yrinic acid a,c-diamide adenosyltransferase [archaeon HR01]
METGRGDDGYTDLPKRGRVRKSHPRLEAYGTVDELSSLIGYAASITSHEDLRQILHQIQTHLFHIGAQLAIANHRVGDIYSMVGELEKLINVYERELKPLNRFIYPGGSPDAAFIHVCRAAARRCERRVASLSDIEEVDPAILTYLNRLSTLLFTLARTANKRSGVGDREWVRS